MLSSCLQWWRSGMKLNRNIKMCGKLQSSFWWQQEWTCGAVASYKYYEVKCCRPWKHTNKENPFDSCNNREGSILGLNVQNTPNNPSPVIRSSSASVRSVCCCCCFFLFFCFYCCLGKRSNFVLGISSAVGCLRLSLSNLYRVIFLANILTEMSLKCNIFSPFKAKSDPPNASGSEK